MTINSYAKVLGVVVSGDVRKKCFLARSNKELPVDILLVLALDESPWVRRVVAKRENLPQSVLDIFVRDQDWLVRYSTVQHALPQYLVRIFANDPSFQIRNMAKRRMY
jgi:hypothetical protein